MNVIVVVLDTFRADIVGPGKTLSHVKTPNLDAFAESGITFDRAFGEGQPTLQIRRAFYTGQRSFPWRYNFDRRGHWHHAPGWHKIPPEQDTIAEILSQRGYMTGLISDVYHMFKPTMNYWRGFTNWQFIRGQESDNYRGGPIESIAKELQRCLVNPSAAYDRDGALRHSTLIQYLLNMRDRKREEDYLCAKVMLTACEWLEDNARNKPFMLWVEAFDPHEPWDPPVSYADDYFSGGCGKDFIMPSGLRELPSIGQDDVERTKALYFGEVTFVDKWVGALLDKIDGMNLAEDTVVMILSDHGTEVYDRGSFGKGGKQMHPFNTGLLWLMRHPDGPTGERVNGFVQSHDVMPTILDLLDVPYHTDGESVWPLVTGETSSIRDTIVCGWAEFANGSATARASVRTDDWNFVHAVGREEHEPELYDLKTDPEETANVIADHPDVALELGREIEALTGQPLPGKLNEVCDDSSNPIADFLANKP